MKYQNLEEDKQKVKDRKIRKIKIFTLLLGIIAVISLGFLLFTLRFSIYLGINRKGEEKNSAVSEQNPVEAGFKYSTISQTSEYTVEARWDELQANPDLAEANTRRRPDIKNKKIITEQQRPVAQNADKVYQQKILSIARSMALKSLQISSDNPDLKALLACQALLFNEKYQGDHHDVNIYNGLNESLKIFLGQTYNVYYGHSNAVRSVIFIPGTLDFYTGGSDGKILRWNIDDPGKKFQVLTEGRGVIELLRISNNGRYLVCAESGKGLLLFDLRSGLNEPEILKGDETNITGLTIGPENNIVYATGTKNTIEYWNIENLRFMVIVTLDTGINSLDISPDGSILSGGTMDGRLIIWKTKGKVVSKTIYDDSERSVSFVAFSSDGRWLACGNKHGEIMIFKAENFELVSILTGHSAEITDIEFSSDGKTLATSSYDGTVLIWDLSDSGKSPIVMDDNSDCVFSVAFSPDGRYLLSAGRDEHRLIKRPASLKVMAESICTLLTRNLTADEWNRFVGPDVPYERTCLTLKREESGQK